ncbi:MAG: transglutaminase domain-containing protein [Acidobacteria bacterium]|nr:transglutaminase domain-containing protein [Acidobacteriota bacterium]
MDRRDFLRAVAMAAPAFGIATRSVEAESYGDLTSKTPGSGWRTYEVVTSVRVLRPSGRTHVWLPQPLAQNTEFQRTLSSSLQCEGGKTFLHEDARTGLKILCASFPSGAAPAITTVQRVATRDWSVDLNAAVESSTARLPSVPADAASFLRPTTYVPTDGIVKATSEKITAGARTDVEKTRAVYEWIVKNTYRKPAVRGCGVGDIRPMLETGDLGGKCADLNGLFVGLVKASGVPARDVYGLRVGRSDLECSSLGTSSGDVSKAQHCRAEVYLSGFGWVPMDPADVRKVILEEPPGDLSLTGIKVESARHRLFGSWEMNWIAYNYAQDVSLPGSSGPTLPFLMYPQAETELGRLDCLDPESFRYSITSRELTDESS